MTSYENVLHVRAQGVLSYHLIKVMCWWLHDTSEIGTHVRTLYLICVRNLITSIAVLNRMVFLRKGLFSFMRAQHVLSYHLPWELRCFFYLFLLMLQYLWPFLALTAWLVEQGWYDVDNTALHCDRESIIQTKLK